MHHSWMKYQRGATNAQDKGSGRNATISRGQVFSHESTIFGKGYLRTRRFHIRIVEILCRLCEEFLSVAAFQQYNEDWLVL